MRYWWVNHKQTFSQEFGGGYIWAPKRRRDGASNRFYDSLREVEPGDVVFSYADTYIQGAGFAVSYCYSCPRPAEFGRIGEAWDVVGWRVDVKFSPFATPVRPRDHLGLLQPLLAREPTPPLKPDGNGLQHIYLAGIGDALAEALLGLAGLDGIPFRKTAFVDSGLGSLGREALGQEEWETVEARRIEHAEMIDATTRAALVQARVGQGLFKQNVCIHERACRVTMVTNPTHLIGSHIKPWRVSTNDERLRGANGLLLTPDADHLFDRGFISFDDNGELLVAKVADRVSLKRMGIDPEALRPRRPLNVDQRYFMAHHRREEFLGC